VTDCELICSLVRFQSRLDAMDKQELVRCHPVHIAKVQAGHNQTCFCYSQGINQAGIPILPMFWFGLDWAVKLWTNCETANSLTDARGFNL